MELAAILKPAPFVKTEAGDPEQLLQDFKEYVKRFRKFLLATGMAGVHSQDHVNCAACTKAKASLELVGGKEVTVLMEHVGGVEEGDTFDRALEKVEEGIVAQTNQATAKFKLYTKLPQGGLAFGEWYPTVKDQADRCIWTGYGAKQAARDALLFQTDDIKLQRKIIAEDLDYDSVIKYGLAFEQGNKKVHTMRAQKEEVRTEQERVACLEDKVRKLEVKRDKKECRTCIRQHEGKCPALQYTCFACSEVGHAKGSKACKKPKPAVKPKKVDKARQVQEEETDSDSEGVGRVTEVEPVRAVRHADARKATVTMTGVDKGTPGVATQTQLLIDSGVHKTLISEKDWKQISRRNADGYQIKLKINKTKFRPYGTNMSLPILGRTKCRMTAENGQEVFTIVYVVRGETESLLGLKDGEALGIINIDPKGKKPEVIRQLDEGKLPELKKVSEADKREMEEKMQRILEPHEEMFHGIGVAKVDPVHIEIDQAIKPVQQKRRPIALHYQDKFKAHIEELKRAGVVSGPLKSESAGGWIHNVVITQKSWTSKKIRVNLDTRPMKDAVKTTHFPIPTPQELRHNFAGSDRYSVVDLNHAFHQFALDKESQELFVFYTPWGLYKYNTLVMGVSSASSECHERIRRIVEGLEGIQQIKDDIVVHGKGEEHDKRLKALLERLQQHNITLRREKCEFGVDRVKWFGYVYSERGMEVDAERKAVIKAWEAPKDKKEVKSFLQTVAFCQVFMRPGQGRTYSDVTAPLRELTGKHTRFNWTKECQDSFMELKRLLVSDKVMANYDPTRETRLYCDDGPKGVAATVAQGYKVEGVDHTVWRPVTYTSRAKTETECNYGKVDGESLAVLSGILTNKMYLYGTRFTVITDHKPIVPMYNSHSKSIPVRVAKHKSKLRAFDFDVAYEAGVTTPSDYGSRHPPGSKEYSQAERELLGVEAEEEDAEILIARLDMVEDAVTMPIMAKYTDTEYKELVEDIRQGTLSKERAKLKGVQECWEELSIHEGVIMRGERLLIPTKLRRSVLAAAHEGCPGKDAMLRQLRQDVWWPGMDGDVKNFTSSCTGCAAAIPRNIIPPMTIRQTPERVWSEVQADFKGPIAGRYYFHVLIDQLSRWPEVEVVTSTSFEKLKPALERSWSLLGVPDQVVHDNGPPYNSAEWRKYAREKGFKLKPCTPEHPKSNSIVERFMGVLVKTVHVAVAMGKDPVTEVQRRLMNYRNTPHPSTGKSPSELMMGRRLKTKIPARLAASDTQAHQEAKEKDKVTRSKRKEVYDKKHRTQEQEIKPGDMVLVKQQKTTTKPPFDPKPYQVKEVKGTQITVIRGKQQKVRSKEKVKLLRKRAEHLRGGSTESYNQEEMREELDEEDDWDINLQDKPQKSIREDRVRVEIPEGEETVPAAQLDHQPQIRVTAASPHSTRKSGRQTKKPERLGAAATEEQTRQLSPRERKKRQSRARFGLKKTFIREQGQWKVGTEQEGEDAD